MDLTEDKGQSTKKRECLSDVGEMPDNHAVREYMQNNDLVCCMQDKMLIILAKFWCEDPDRKGPDQGKLSYTADCDNISEKKIIVGDGSDENNNRKLKDYLTDIDMVCCLDGS